MIETCRKCGNDFLTEADPYVVYPKTSGVELYCTCQILFANNIEWITDRLPTANDTSRRLNWCVWTLHKGDSTMWSYDGVIPGQPWMPITLPEPYVKAKRYIVNYENSRKVLWYVWDEVDRYYVANKIPTREAAERIAAIYEEVMP